MEPVSSFPNCQTHVRQFASLPPFCQNLRRWVCADITPHRRDGPVRWALGWATPTRTGSFFLPRGPSSPPPSSGWFTSPSDRPTRRANAHTLVNDGCVKFALLPSHASLPPSLSLLQFVSQNEREAVTLARISPFHCSVLCLVMIHHHSRDSPPLGRRAVSLTVTHEQEEHDHRRRLQHWPKF